MREYHYHSRGDLRPGNRTSAGREFSGETYTTGRVATLATPSATPANRVEPRGAGLVRRESSLGKRGRSHDYPSFEPATASASSFRHPPVDYLGEDEEASDEIVTEFRSSSNGEEEEEEGVEWCTASLGYRPRQQQQQQQKQQVLSRLGGGPDNNASEIQAGHTAATGTVLSFFFILIWKQFFWSFKLLQDNKTEYTWCSIFYPFASLLRPRGIPEVHRNTHLLYVQLIQCTYNKHFSAIHFVHCVYAKCSKCT